MSDMQQTPKRQLGRDGPWVSAIGLGTMGTLPFTLKAFTSSEHTCPGFGAFYGQSNEKETLETLTYAAKRGMTFWDTADVYGSCL